MGARSWRIRLSVAITDLAYRPESEAPVYIMWITVDTELRTQQTFLYYTPAYGGCQGNERLKFFQAAAKDRGVLFRNLNRIGGRVLPLLNGEYTLR